MADPDDDAPSIIVDPIEAALAKQHTYLGTEIEGLVSDIARDEAKIKRMRESMKRLDADRSAIKAHLDENFEGWDIRLAETENAENAKRRR